MYCIYSRIIQNLTIFFLRKQKMSCSPAFPSQFFVCFLTSDTIVVFVSLALREFYARTYGTAAILNKSLSSRKIVVVFAVSVGVLFFCHEAMLTRAPTGQISTCLSVRRVGSGPLFIRWNSTSCSRLGNLVRPPSSEKAVRPSCISCK
jgi:hypothetical protein